MLHVSLLGEQAIVDDATGTVRARSSRAIALIGLLAVHAGVPQTRQLIAGLFWPDSTGGQALTNLRRELHHLRQVLDGEPALVVTPRDLSWRDTAGCVVDVRAFARERAAALAAAEREDSPAVHTHAAAAVAEYRGDFLPGLYDDWLLATRSRLERECVELCDLLSRTRSRTGDLAGAVDAARQRVQLAPLEEVGYRSLMRLQADLGDRAGAVNTYHRCASVLERQLGLEPDASTRAALEQLLARTPAEPAAVRRSGPAAAELVGRAAEVAGLRARWKTAAAGSPGLLLVRGDAGVGKTRLVTELAGIAAQDGAVVATTRCFGTSRRLALSPVADWLRSPAVKSAAARLGPVWRAEVERLVPAVPERGAGTGETRGGPGAGRAMVDAWQRHRFFEGMARALINVGRPLLLVLDNVHWCDQETLAFVAFYLTLEPDTPVLVAGTLRDEADAEPGLAEWITGMRAAQKVTELRLGQLEASESARLAEAISGRPLAADAVPLLHAVTGGFPLHVVEAARTLVDQRDAAVPVGDLTAVLRNRLEQLSPVALQVAGLAAAAGRNVTLDLLAEASDLDADSVVRAVDELWRRRILREVRDGYDFTHDLLREAAYLRVNPPARWLLHRRLAQALELLHRDDTDAVSAELAEQYARGGRPDRAVAYYRRAADIAGGRFAHREAIRLHEDALAVVRTLPPGPGRDGRELDVLEAMAAPLNACLGYSALELQATLHRSVVLAEGLGRRESELVALIGLWSTQFVRGDTEAALGTVTRVLDAVDADSTLQGPAHFAFGGSELSLGRPATAVHHFSLAASVTRGRPSLTIGTRPDVHGRAWAAHAHWLLGDDDTALASCREALALARDIGHPYNLAVALAYAAITHQLRQDAGELGAVVAELSELCQRYGFAYYREWALVLDGWCRGGEAGAALARQGIGNLRAQGAFARMPYWLSLAADLSARAGRPDVAAATLDAASADGRARQDVWWLPEVLRRRAEYDGPAAAVDRLRAAAAMARGHGSTALLRRCEGDLAARAFAGTGGDPNAARTPAS